MVRLLLYKRTPQVWNLLIISSLEIRPLSVLGISLSKPWTRYGQTNHSVVKLISTLIIIWTLLGWDISTKSSFSRFYDLDKIKIIIKLMSKMSNWMIYSCKCLNIFTIKIELKIFNLKIWKTNFIRCKKRYLKVNLISTLPYTYFHD